MLPLLGGLFLGWSLGANDAANIFGTAVTSRMIRFWKAAVLAAVFVIAGAIISGQAGINTLKGLTQLTLEQAVISSVAAALTVTAMTVVGLPVSTSQSMVGAIIGIGIINQQVNYAGLGKVAACWVGTPLGALVIALVLYHILGYGYNRLNLNLFQSDAVIRTLMVLAGMYGAYALGANNVANVIAVFVGAGMIDADTAAGIGGGSIALGILTFSRPVMETVGKKLVRLDPYSALIVVLAVGATIHFYSLVGVPVSSSQAVIGAVLGAGLVRGVNTVRRKTLYHILAGWLLTPLVACCLTLVIHFAIHLRYTP
jgi:PiT family inorganic phosphate transporter